MKTDTPRSLLPRLVLFVTSLLVGMTVFTGGAAEAPYRQPATTVPATATQDSGVHAELRESKPHSYRVKVALRGAEQIDAAIAAGLAGARLGTHEYEAGPALWHRLIEAGLDVRAIGSLYEFEVTAPSVPPLSSGAANACRPPDETDASTERDDATGKLLLAHATRSVASPGTIYRHHNPTNVGAHGSGGETGTAALPDDKDLVALDCFPSDTGAPWPQPLAEVAAGQSVHICFMFRLFPDTAFPVNTDVSVQLDDRAPFTHHDYSTWPTYDNVIIGYTFTATPGFHRIQGWVDINNTTVETDETNNYRDENPSFIVPGLAPDMHVEPTALIFDCTTRSASNGTDNDIAPALPTDAAQKGDVEPVNKLISPEQIMQAFDEGYETTDIIVGLREPAAVLQGVDWNDPPSLAAWHQEVHRLQAAVLDMVPLQDLTVRHRFDNQAGFSATVTREGLKRLMGDPNVVTIEPVGTVEPYGAQGIPLINGMVDRAEYNGSGVSIAVVDTGVDYNHPRLGGGGFPNLKVIGGRDFLNGDNDPAPLPFLPSDAHGTGCAGIAAGSLGTVDDYIGGVAYNAKLYALKIGDSVSGPMSIDHAIAAWDWCVTHKDDDPANPILLINNSFGGLHFQGVCDTGTPQLTAAAGRATAAGITLVAAAGNEGYCDALASPACLSDVISVGAVYDSGLGVMEGCVTALSCVGAPCPRCTVFPNCYVDNPLTADVVPSYSNSADMLDLLAPANNANTCDIVGLPGNSPGDFAPRFGGTSAACAYVAGAAAALQSAAMANTGGYLTPAEIRTTLVATGDLVIDPKANNIKPRLNLGDAIDRIELDCDGRIITIYNDGPGALTVDSISGPDWITAAPQPVFDVPAGGIRKVCLEVDCLACAGADLLGTVTVYSNDPQAEHISVTVNCPVPSFCGNGTCDPDEDPCTCPADCDGCCTDKDCSDGDPCTDDPCITFNCAHYASPDGTPCPDGERCNGEETCQGGLCAQGPYPCDDGIACTDDLCTEKPAGYSCEYAPNHAFCNDGFFCNGIETCDPGIGCRFANFPCGPAAWCDETWDQCRLYGTGDYDGDGDHDLADFAAMQRCFGTLDDSDCHPCNLVGAYGIIDARDYAEFLLYFAGP